MKKVVLILSLIALLFATPFAVSNIANAKTAPKKPAKVVIKKPAPKKAPKKVLGIFTSLLSGGFVNCSMPDGKTIKIPKKTCDDVTAFWNSHKPSNPGSSNNSGGGNSGGGGGGGGNNSGNDNPNPFPQTVTNAQIMPCTSSSCGFIKTIKVTGTQFDTTSRIELTSGGKTYGQNTSFNYSHDATLVGITSTEIIMDFYKLPACTTYGVQVNHYGHIFISPVSITTPCI